MLVIWWDLDDDPNGNVQHIAQHGLSKEEVEDVLLDPVELTRSRTSGRPKAIGRTSTGRWIAVVYEDYGEDGWKPVTASEVREP